MTEREKRYHHGDLRTALIAEGIAMLDEVGPEALSLRGLAARVGVSHTAPKNHFGSLKGLLSAIAAEGFRRHRQAMQAGLGAASGPGERLAAALEGYAAFAAAHPGLFQLMFSPMHCDFDDPELKVAAAESYDVLRGVARGLDWTPMTGAGGPAATEAMLWSLVHGYAQLRQMRLLGAKGEDGHVPEILEIVPRPSYRGID